MLTETLLTRLRCPVCQGDLDAQLTHDEDHAAEGRLLCETCELTFPVEGGIPDLIPYNALIGGKWDVWRSHLEGFRSRRERMETRPSRIPRRWTRTHAAFLDFANLARGPVLDIGCGPGGLRYRLNPAHNDYVGLDPLPAAASLEFPFVKAIAERLPFADGTFTSLIVSSALDHFCDVEGFFGEAKRVLAAGGRLFIQQSVHDTSGVGAAARMVVHRVKDSLDNLRTVRVRHGAPKHMTEFDRSSLCQASSASFEFDRMKEYNAAWYSPSKMFIALRPREMSAAGAY